VALGLLPFQTVGAEHLASRHRAALFDRPGLGKSAQAIGALDRIGAKRVLIICPAAVRQVWVGEAGKFSRIQRRVLKGKDIQDLNLFLRHRCDVLILSYEMATAWAKKLEGDLIDAIVFDESHYLKNKEAVRTRALLGHDCDGKGGLARWGASVFFLSGSPNPNDAADIWSTMRFCGATPLTQRIFRDRYFKKRVGAYSTSHIPREETLPELKQAIKSFSLTRTLADAGVTLPPIWLTTVTVDGDTREIRDLLGAYPDLEGAIKEAVEKGGLSFLDAQHIATLRRLVGEAKAPAYVEMLKEELHDGLDKIVVFGLHVRALDRIFSGLTDAGFGVVRFDGSSSEVQRQSAVERFAGDPGVRVFLGNIRAAGTGLTLNTSHRVDMFESDWSPAGNAQALLRVHRIGQECSVHARFITLANSIDVYVSDTVARKTAAIARTGFQSMVA
jgi:SWI/SNF-related matrix-associated actin-dependent regulator of chromatin subfamily A-like protein 1